MNRETSIHARDTLIVTERRQNRRWVIIAVVVVALLAIGLIVMKGHGTKTAAPAPGGPRCRSRRWPKTMWCARSKC